MTSVRTAAPPRRRRRGLEGSVDMLRSLAVVLVGVIMLWFFGQASASDQKTVRTVDSTEDVAAWRAAVPAAAVPTAPAGWLPTVTQFVPQPPVLRLGWNTPGRQYIEFAASTGPAGPFIASTAGSGATTGTVDVGGTTWQRYVDGDGSVSLVRTTAGGVTVIVGTTRENAPDSDVVALARTLQP